MKTDWLASDTIFYNTLTNKISKNINDVIDFENFAWHKEGLYNYLDFGYSILEQTPIKNVKFLRYSSSIEKDEKGQIKVNYLEDPAEKWQGKTTHPDDVLNLLNKKVKTWEKSVQGNIILPISGGYDSRLLSLLIEDKSRVQSFTYGVSLDQSRSLEIVHAKKVTEILNIDWRQIELGRFHIYFDDWYKEYGVSTHAHGMYHIEFYEKMKPFVQGNNPFLSGLIGDAWAGRVNIKDVDTISQLTNIGYSHGLRADPNYLNKNITSFDLREKYFGEKKDNIKNDYWKVIESMRFKLILLNYLLRMPEKFGFSTYAPFLDIEIALSMLSLPADKKKDRIWQKEFFQKNNLDIESMKLDNISLTNDLNTEAAKNVKLKSLSSKLLSEIIDTKYIDWINKNTYQGINPRLKDYIIDKFSFIADKRILWRLLPKKASFIQEAYCAYLTLYPLQKIIEQRNDYFKTK